MVRLVAQADDAGQTLERLLKKALPHLGLSAIHKLVRTKQVRVDGKRTNDLKLVIRQGDEVVVFVDTVQAKRTVPAAPMARSANRPALEVVYEGEGMLLVNKPRGLPVHDETGADHLDAWVVDYLIAKGAYDPAASHTFAPSHVHRIDAPTGGIVVYATNRARLVELNELIKDHDRFKKYYKAKVEGRFDGPLDVTGYIQKDYTHGNRMSFGKNPSKDAQLCRTMFKIVRYDEATDTTDLEVRLMTGRKHQIRATLGFLKHPIVGDDRYGAKTAGSLELFAYRVVINGRAFTL